MFTSEQFVVWVFQADPRVETVVEYDGFVPNSYKWRCPRTKLIHTATGTESGMYDAKRSIHAPRPWMVARTNRKGKIFSC